MGFADPVAEAAALRHASADIAQGDPSEQCTIAAAEKQPAIAQIFPPLDSDHAHAPSKSSPPESIGGPDRLPGHEEIAALPTQFGPAAPVGIARRADENAPA